VPVFLDTIVVLETLLGVFGSPGQPLPEHAPLSPFVSAEYRYVVRIFYECASWAFEQLDGSNGLKPPAGDGRFLRLFKSRLPTFTSGAWDLLGVYGETFARQIQNEPQRFETREQLRANQAAAQRALSCLTGVPVEGAGEAKSCSWSEWFEPAFCKTPHPGNCGLKDILEPLLSDQAGREALLHALTMLASQQLAESPAIDNRLPAIDKALGEPDPVHDLVVIVTRSDNIFGDLLVFLEAPVGAEILSTDRAFDVLARSDLPERRRRPTRSGPPRQDGEKKPCTIRPSSGSPLTGQLEDWSPSSAGVSGILPDMLKREEWVEIETVHFGKRKAQVKRVPRGNGLPKDWYGLEFQ